MTLTEFLLARIAEDEATAQQYPALGMKSAWELSVDFDRDYCEPSGIVIDPARVLAECVAKRKIVDMAIGVEEHRSAAESLEYGNDLHAIPVAQAVDETMIDVLQYLTAPYADHPDCLPEWGL